MIKQKTVQEIFETAKVEDVVGDYVHLKKRGINMLGLCPFHNEKTPSFTVSPGKNIYKCFGCGKGGGPIQFLMEHESFSYPEALRFLANKYGIEIEETQATAEQLQERQLVDSLFIINDYAQKHFEEQLHETDIGKSVGLSYFKQRGFREETIKKFQLGFAPNKKDDLTLKAVQDGHDIELFKKAGLTSKYNSDFFRNRVMFTIHNLSGKIVAFAGRILQKDVKAPKYINSPETEVYNKSKTLYALHLAKKHIQKEDECIMVEGYTDVISLHQGGIENVVASSGTSLTEGQIRLIKRYSPNVKFIYDGDKAGIKAALRGLDLVLEQDMNVKVVVLPDGEDPDSYLQSVGSTAFKAYTDEQAKDFILFKTELLLAESKNDPTKKAMVVKDIVKSISKIPDFIKRSIFIKECSNLMNVEEEALVAELNKLLANQKHQSQNKAQNPREKSQNQTPVLDKPAKEKAQGDEFQEKDIIRILVEFGHHPIEADSDATVAEYILGNIEEVLEEFDNTLYAKIAALAHQAVSKGENIQTNFYLNHSDDKISTACISILMQPWQYSEGWINRWDSPLQTQKPPELNFTKDTIASVNRFKLRKVLKLCEKNQQRLRFVNDTGDMEQYMKLLKVQQKLYQIRDELAKLCGTVVLK